MIPEVVYGPVDYCSDYIWNFGYEGFYDKSTGKVKECYHSAPVESTIRKDLKRNFQENVFRWAEGRVLYHPLKLHVSIQLVSDLLKALSELHVVRVRQLLRPQLFPGHYSVTVYMPPNPLVDETARGQNTGKRLICSAGSFIKLIIYKTTIMLIQLRNQ